MSEETKPMTIQQYLSLTPDQQGIEAAKCLTPKPWKHNIDKTGHAHKLGHKKHCVKCGWYRQLPVNCKKPDPLTLDKKTAWKHQQGISELGYLNGLEAVYATINPKHTFNYWALYEKRAVEDIAAAMAAKGYFKETK